MENERVLASLSYFSIFFAPFLFPIILYLIVKEEFIKHHAKRALLSHLVPVVFGFILMFFLLTGSLLTEANNSAGTGIAIGYVIGMIAYFAVTIGFFIWNIVQGIRVLKF
ncbi:hypothetical protein CH76_10925 [Lysinibacillus sp. BF-4]|uniref:DUF4870 domain-containing protein n=1 Tax=Lysinibacillus sp. BF-4 TaxID=1473546 RepID=UPI000501E155|nr:DUF4870 domain-containing protein [Lysinibacillus sp. BF-4]KFL42708.1 hypothetical protein CH76_10925 [Lysinibacillus sp. BF-4]